MSELRTIVATLTPPGRSALAVLAVRGPHAWEVVEEIFKPRGGRLPDVPEVGRFWLGRIGDEAKDDAVLAVRDPQSLELHVHGGREVVRWLTDLLVAREVTPVAWTETRTSPLEVVASTTLAEALTVRTAAIALDQHNGVLGKAIGALDEARGTPQYKTLRSDLLRWSRLGEHLAKPWRVVLAGAPNVGKSSLLNALAGYQRSIVAPTPGTTRDVVAVTLAIDGWPVEVCDTAGLRKSSESLEGQGIELAQEAIRAADLCLWLLDATAEPVWPTEGMNNIRLVINKIDQEPAWDLTRAGDALRVSATTGEGLPALCAAISRHLIPEVPPSGTAVPLPGVSVP